MAFGMSPRAGRVLSGALAILSLAAFATCLVLRATPPAPTRSFAKCAKDELLAHPELAATTDADRQGVLRIVVPEKTEHAFSDRICVIVAGVSLARLKFSEDEARAKTKWEDLRTKAAAAETALTVANRKLAEAAGGDIALQQKEVEKAQSAAKAAQTDRDTAETAYNEAHGKSLAPPASVELVPFLDNVKADWAKMKVNALEAPQLVSLDLGSPLDLRESAAKFWRGVLSGARDRAAGTASVALAVARANSDVAEQSDSSVAVEYRLYLQAPLLAGALGVVLLAFSIIVLASDSSLLRDNNEVDLKDPTVADGPWSLGRVQMALWMLLVLSAFLFFWLVLGQYNNIITPGLLILLGINSTTGLLAIAVGPDTAKDAAKPRSKHFIADLLGTQDGPQLHRIQVIIWTIVLALVFMWNVVYSFTIVNFDTNLLLLMGIAQSIYIGFKWQESPK